MKILLTTLHAKYVHASLALPCLAAACAGLHDVDITIREYTINEAPEQLLRKLAAGNPDVAAFSCYIWNIELTLRLITELKQLLPRTIIVLGGPEVSYGSFELMEQNRAVDFIVKGEGEETFRELAAHLAETGGGIHREITGLVYRDVEDIMASPEHAPISNLDTIRSPFAAGLVDLEKPLVYYETSRGCPFSCAFCLSSREKGVRSFSEMRIETDLALLMARGVKTVKLVDRTFNFDHLRADRIWEFILHNNRASRFHFEIAADLLTEENLRILATVPPDTFRFEIGVQSGEEETLARVARCFDMERLFANVLRLVAETSVTIHLDLVAGLPGEDFSGFLRSLQLLLDAAPHHVQVEPLKVLKGAAMRRIAQDEGYEFSAAPPYRILRTPWLSFREICRIEDIARLLDLYYNSGRFETTLTIMAASTPLSQLFADLAAFREEHEPPGGTSLHHLFDAFWNFAKEYSIDGEIVREALCYDYCRADYPTAGNVPDFFPGMNGPMPGGRQPDTVSRLASRLGISAGSRVRYFRQTFSRDFRQIPALPQETRLLFVYISAPGKGLAIRTLEDEG